LPRRSRAVQRPDEQFLIAGHGRQRAWAERQMRNLGLGDRVMFLGRLLWQDLQERFAEVDLFLFTSLRDTLGAVIFEAMAKGPVMCLNHNGVGAHLPEAAAIKVSVTTCRAVVHEMARRIDALAADRARLRRMSEAAYRFATTQQWHGRAMVMEQLYHQVLAQRETNQATAVVVDRSMPTLE
jgi:1,2-diacylglycerol 3-alpha-glucosyltransferase